MRQQSTARYAGPRGRQPQLSTFCNRQAQQSQHPVRDVSRADGSYRASAPYRATDGWALRSKAGEDVGAAGTASADAAKNAPARLFSNLNPLTLKHEPGSVWGSGLLVAGTTVGAGILALPAVTQDAGFIASTTALAGCCVFSIITGLLLAEVNINTMCELGAGGVSLVSMARRTLGPQATVLAGSAYALLHYALLVAYIGKGAEVLAAVMQGGAGSGAAEGGGAVTAAAATAFVAAFGGLCYWSSPGVLDAVNGGLVVLVVAAFVGLLGAAGGGADPAELARANWGAVPATLPVIALAFVYHNVVPVVTSSLEGDVAKIRTAIVAGVLLPFVMFVSWDAAVLGSLGSLGAAPDGQPAAVSASPEAPAPDAGAAEAMAPGGQLPRHAQVAAAGDGGKQALPLVGGGRNAIEAAAGPGLAMQAQLEPLASPQLPQQQLARPRQRVEDPLAALAASSPVVGPLVQLFSFLAVATSFIGFVLGLTDFIAGVLQLPGGRQSLLPYALALAPPLVLALSYPGIFLQALDTAGTFGVLTLFGIMPAAMTWSERYRDTTLSKVEVVPGGRPVLIGVAGVAAAVILNEVFGALTGLMSATGS